MKLLRTWTQSLGCPKNRVDTERALGSLGIPVKPVAHLGHAQLVLINTCAFIEPASRESLRAIFDAANHIKHLKRKPVFAVAGCLPGRYGRDTLAKEIPEVDLWLESSEIDTWPQKLLSALGLAARPASGRILSTQGYAWLKISEGCFRNCSFCTIPSIRGPLVSTPAQALLAEASQLVEQGSKEIILVGQDITAWGRDFLMQGAKGDAGHRLPDLLRLLREITGLRWLRMMYLYPNAITDDLLAIIREGAPILPYLDIPFQHCQPNILSKMGRAFKTQPSQIIAQVRKFLPGAALRTTLMVGFPGESERDFIALCEFVKNSRFQNLGVFAFVPEEGTRAANLPDQIPDSVKEERRNEIMRIQADISQSLLEEYKGQPMEVLVDAPLEQEWPGLHAGRVWFQAPEVDGVTYISGHDVEPGIMVKAEITDSSVYDLSALAEP